MRFMKKTQKVKIAITAADQDLLEKTYQQLCKSFVILDEEDGDGDDYILTVCGKWEYFDAPEDFLENMAKYEGAKISNSYDVARADQYTEEYKKIVDSVSFKGIFYTFADLNDTKE